MKHAMGLCILLITIVFISHTVQMKPGFKVRQKMQELLFISHTVQMKLSPEEKAKYKSLNFISHTVQMKQV